MVKLTLNTAALLAALKKSKDVIEKNPSLPVLSNVLIQADGKTMKITSSDNEITLITSVELTEEVEAFSALLPFEYMFKTIELAQAENLTIEFKDGNAAIKAGNDSTDIKKLPEVGEFIKVPTFPKQSSITVDASFMRTLSLALKTTNEKGATYASYVCIDLQADKTVIVSTNAATLFTKSFAIKSEAEPTQLLLKKKVVKAVKDFELTTIAWNKNHIAFENDGVKIVAKRSDANFVKYETVIPEKNENLVLDRAELEHALKQAMIIAPSAGAKFTFSENTVSIEALNPDNNISKILTIHSEFDHTVLIEAIKLVPEQFMNLVEQIDYTAINLTITAPNKGVLITSEDENYKALIMPMI